MTSNGKPSAVLIAGPTASGKSAEAIKLAGQFDGVIINTDSMQVYRQLHIITARPSADEMAQCPHLLYGHRDAKIPYSVAEWVGEVRQVLADEIPHGKIPIFVGGTGLYFKGLLEGLSPVPPIAQDVRRKWREFGAHSGDKLHGELMSRDPQSAAQLRSSDHQRILRALEVVDSTDVSILEWQNRDNGAAILSGDQLRKIVIMPQRADLHTRINQRFDNMVEMGGVDEVEEFIKLGIDPGLPAVKAIGVRQLAGYLSGDTSLEQAIEMAKAATRQYAKRQSTWFNNQFGDDWQRQ